MKLFLVLKMCHDCDSVAAMHCGPCSCALTWRQVRAHVIQFVPLSELPPFLKYVLKTEKGVKKTGHLRVKNSWYHWKAAYKKSSKLTSTSGVLTLFSTPLHDHAHIRCRCVVSISHYTSDYRPLKTLSTKVHSCETQFDHAHDYEVTFICYLFVIWSKFYLFSVMYPLSQHVCQYVSVSVTTLLLEKKKNIDNYWTVGTQPIILSNLVHSRKLDLKM